MAAEHAANPQRRIVEPLTLQHPHWEMSRADEERVVNSEVEKGLSKP